MYQSDVKIWLRVRPTDYMLPDGFHVRERPEGPATASPEGPPLAAHGDSGRAGGSAPQPAQSCWTQMGRGTLGNTPVRMRDVSGTRES